MKTLSGRLSTSEVTRTFRRRGFSLVELLAVLTIMAVVSGIAFMAVGVSNSNNLDKAAYDIQGALEQARTMAMASDTYTWVGFFEESPANPGVAGTGQVVVFIVSSTDGTNIYSTLSGGVTQLPGARLTQMSKLVRIPNVHLASLSAAAATRPSVPAATYEVAGSSFANTYTFAYPLGAVSPSYTFANIIQFNPLGDATRIADTPTQIMEIGLQPAHGAVAATFSNDVAAIQVAGIGGHVTTYFP